ncbi:MAG: ribonuclease HI family protein [Deltaproteobacteria bacterium]|nr:ribonuclease HI family protein [Deltaproteobacteria bacterium]
MTAAHGFDDDKRAGIFRALAQGMEIPEVLERFHLSREELKALFLEVAESYKARQSGYWHLFCDGASRGNPGPAGAGAVLLDPGGQPQGRAVRFLGKATNSIAEYQALLLGLEMALEKGVRRLQIFSDSQLLVEQLNGGYQVRSPHLKPFWRQAMNLLQNFEAYAISHIDRTMNAEADRLANQAIDRHSE